MQETQWFTEVLTLPFWKPFFDFPWILEFDSWLMEGSSLNGISHWNFRKDLMKMLLKGLSYCTEFFKCVSFLYRHDREKRHPKKKTYQSKMLMVVFLSEWFSYKVTITACLHVTVYFRNLYNLSMYCSDNQREENSLSL